MPRQRKPREQSDDQKQLWKVKLSQLKRLDIYVPLLMFDYGFSGSELTLILYLSILQSSNSDKKSISVTQRSIKEQTQLSLDAINKAMAVIEKMKIIHREQGRGISTYKGSNKQDKKEGYISEPTTITVLPIDKWLPPWEIEKCRISLTKARDRKRKSNLKPVIKNSHLDANSKEV